MYSSNPDIDRIHYKNSYILFLIDISKFTETLTDDDKSDPKPQLRCTNKQ